jgi:hypothetical protein
MDQKEIDAFVQKIHAQDAYGAAMIVQSCAKALGWDLHTEDSEKYPDLRGLAIGTPEYLEENFPEGPRFQYLGDK